MNLFGKSPVENTMTHEWAASIVLASAVLLLVVFALSVYLTPIWYRWIPVLAWVCLGIAVRSWWKSGG